MEMYITRPISISSPGKYLHNVTVQLMGLILLCIIICTLTTIIRVMKSARWMSYAVNGYKILNKRYHFENTVASGRI
jgi:hypothetical protein